MNDLPLGGEGENVAPRAAAALPDHEGAVASPVGEEGGVGLVPAHPRLVPGLARSGRVHVLEVGGGRGPGDPWGRPEAGLHVCDFCGLPWVRDDPAPGAREVHGGVVRVQTILQHKWKYLVQIISITKYFVLKGFPHKVDILHIF